MVENQELEVLVKSQKKYSDASYTDKQLAKCIGDPKAGCNITIEWRGNILKGIKDYGYCFSLPMCDDNYEMYDFFVHIPSPDNSSGIGDVPQEFIHVGELIKSTLIKSLHFK